MSQYNCQLAIKTGVNCQLVKGWNIRNLKNSIYIQVVISYFIVYIDDSNPIKGGCETESQASNSADCSTESETSSDSGKIQND